MAEKREAAGVPCPWCGCHDSRVLWNEYSETKRENVRRRKCQACHRRFTTRESAEPAYEVVPL